MRKKLLAIAGCLSGLIGFAQNDCAEAVKLAKTYLSGTAKTKPDYTKVYAAMQDCVIQGDAEAIFLSANMLLNGLGVEKDEKEAFRYMMYAASQEHVEAQYLVGVFYRLGIGCKIDYVQSLLWLIRASDHNHPKAGYLIGCIALKGLGVPQNYEAAHAWLERSPDPMAKYWLGNCYYFGLGVPKDTQKAIQYYTQSNTSGSRQFLKQIANHAMEKADATTDNQLKETETPKNTAIAQEIIEKLTIETPGPQIHRLNLNDKIVNGKLNGKEVQGKALKAKYLNGKWKGKLVELEWSGKQIMQVLPLQCEFAEQKGKVNAKWEINKTTSQANALWEDNTLYFDQLKMIFDSPFSDDANIKTIGWQVLSTQVAFKTINKKTYLTGHLETYNPILKEPGPPMRIILKQLEEGDDEELTDSELLAISQQKDQFIDLYPNPFVNDAQIAYTLNVAAMVSVNVYDLTGNPAPVILEPGIMQTPGEHHYTLDGAKLKAGMYIVKVAVGDKLYSRILIKQ
jgi:uncharacterized protein